jgi:hypothetical protein
MKARTSARRTAGRSSASVVWTCHYSASHEFTYFIGCYHGTSAL